MRRPLVLTVLVAAALVLTGCSASEPAATPSASYDPAATIDIQAGLEPTSLDMTTVSGSALQQLMLGNVYEGLVLRTQENKLVPGLATSWKTSSDGLGYTFTLRKGVKFSDGSTVTADDVVWSLDRTIAPGSKNPDAKLYAAVSTIASPDPDTIVITLKSRNINFLDALGGSGGVILNKESTADLNSTTDGTGPYKVTQWNKGSTITLAPVPGYWGAKPKNGGVVFHYITDPTTAANALKTGQIDILTTATADTTPLFANDANYKVTSGAATSWMTLGFNQASGPLTDKRVREAIRMGIDKKGLIKVLGGQAIQVGSMTVPTDPWYEDLTSIDAYNPSKAKQLLADAGQSDLTLTLTVANTYDARISDYLVAQLGQIGITLKVNTVEFATWLDQAYTKRQYELTMVLHVDPWELTYYGLSNYYWNYDNPDAQKLATEAQQAKTIDERNDDMKQLGKLVAEDAASDWLYSPTTVVVANKKVAGYPTDLIVNHYLLSPITAAE